MINDKACEVSDNAALADLTQLQNLPSQGIAVALNMHFVPRASWTETKLNEGDRIIIIKAVCGG